LWGLVFGDWLSRFFKSKGLVIEVARGTVWWDDYGPFFYSEPFGDIPVYVTYQTVLIYIIDLENEPKGLDSTDTHE
jgi:hypothetical protein